MIRLGNKKATAACVVGMSASLGLAFASEPVVRVEEDWVLRLNEPNENATSPQFHSVMSPTSNTDSYYAQVVWNYREYGDVFESGGLQLQAWTGDDLLRSRAVGSAPLSTEAETVTWTQVLEVDNSGALSFEIADGHSSTWGLFDKDMRLAGFSRYDDLNQYSTDVSTGNACITYGSNRVEVLMISQVRRYGVDGLLYVDNEPHVIYQYEE